jgi:hypothetical protein
VHSTALHARIPAGAFLAAALLAALGLLLIAGGGPLGPALATFALGVLAVAAAAFVRATFLRYRRRGAMQAAERVALDAAAALPDAPPVLRALTGELEPVSLGAVARTVAARTGARLVVERDAQVRAAELEAALVALVGAADGDPSLAVRGTRVELRGDVSEEGLPAAFARVVAQRGGGDLHVLDGLAVLTFREG